MRCFSNPQPLKNTTALNTSPSSQFNNGVRNKGKSVFKSLPFVFVVLFGLLFVNTCIGITVTNTNDSGSGSLRAAIASSSSGSVIDFSASLISTGSATILLSSVIYIDYDITINGLLSATDTLYISGNGATQIFYIRPTGSNITTYLNNLVLIDGNATPYDGGAISCNRGNLEINNCVIRGCTANYGGAVNFRESDSFFQLTLVVNNSSFYNNSATSYGGAIYCQETLSQGTNTARVEVNESTLSSNYAGSDGSAIYCRASVSSANYPGNVYARIYIRQSTIANNTGPSNRSAIYAVSDYSNNSASDGYTYIYLYNSTVVNNAGRSLHGSGETDSEMYLRSSIVAFNGNTIFNGGSPITSEGYNIFSRSSVSGSGATDHLGVTAAALALTDLRLNGGTTKTMSPTAGSLTSDAGYTGSSVDAQNAPIVGRRDIGAAERTTSVSEDIQASCISYSWIDGNTYTSDNNSATVTLVNTAGYDSIVTLNLTIHPIFNETSSASICQGDSYSFGTQTLTTAGSYTELFNSVNGCDSTVTLTLSINPNTSGTDVLTSCGGGFIWIDGNSYTSSNYTATHVLVNSLGCDSVVTLDYTIQDLLPPVADNASLSDVLGQCSVTSLTAPTATDNCAGLIAGTHNASLPITTPGTTVVTWTYDDGNGHTITQTQNVVLNDDTPPVADVGSLPVINSVCSLASLTAPTATDNCVGSVTGTHNASLPITTIGITVVTWSYDDGDGNTSTQTQNVVISACPTCTDGIQNGSETDIDCGGSCAPCPTCSDGIQNGTESGIDCGGICTACYCVPSYTNGTAFGDFIDGVKLGSINNLNTGSITGTDYNDYTSISTDLVTDHTYTMEIIHGTFGALGPGQSDYYSVFIDFNQDGDFDDPSEDVAQFEADQPGEYQSYVFNVWIPGPWFSMLGTTRMRIRTSYGVSGGNACSSYSYGETEDYTINFICQTCETCSDGIQNGTETDIDCGGATCLTCPTDPTCSDGIQNGTETGVDCGGSCTACPTIPTCSDGIQNGTETGVDCGGSCSVCATTTSDLIVSGVFDGPLGGQPKGVEFYVVEAILDLSIYGFGSANNGGGTGGEEFTFPSIAVSAGTFIYVASDATGFTNFMGFNADYIDAAANVNGNDAIELFKNSVVVDLFGDINVDGTGQPWEYMDGWASRKDCEGPGGSVFVSANWNFSGINALDGEILNSTAATPIPAGTYSCGANPTCSDGVQNGDETGVDCGGATCPACPTCSDGVQNGDETGVDCGGSSCPSCSTCSDGVQNGDETGVDCGGTTCPACATCSDGIQNGTETGVDCGGSCAICPPTTSDLIVSGVFDGPLSGQPKGVEFYAVSAISDLSTYGFGSANNGGGTNGEEFTFPAVPIAAGTFIYVAADAIGFNNFIGFSADYISSAASINGDDAIELFKSSVVVDVFGDINMAGTGQSWEYTDGWAFRKDCEGPGSSVFVSANWNYSGVDALDGETLNSTSTSPIPVGSYECIPPCIHTTSTISAIDCDSYISPSGNVWTFSSTFNDTIQNNAGCDSVITVNLTVLNSTSSSDVVTACDSYTWIDGNTYAASNSIATHALTNSAGCDSIITLNLSLSNSNTGTDVITACDTYTWIDGNTYAASNSDATHTLTNAAGCDSIVTLNLSLSNSNIGTDVISACDNYAWIDGNTYTSSNSIATHAVTNVSGCDSVVTLNLTLSNSNTGIDVVSACDSHTWIDGNTYTTSNSAAIHTLTNVAGCDSVVSLNLTLSNSNSGTDVITACSSLTWIDGNTYTEPNSTATHTLTNVAGCDSVVTLDFSLLANTGVDVVAACNSYTWIDGNTYIASNFVATHTLTNVASCDSVVTLNLTLSDSNTGTDIITACDSYTWIDGNTYTAPNSVATHTLTNVAGCDSVITLDLTFSNSITGTDVITACDSYTWIDGNTYTESNSVATQTLTSVAGCDSIVTLNLTLSNSNTGTDVITACDSHTWIDGNTYGASNSVATHTLPNVAGCDSVVTLNLTLLNSNTAIDVITACDSYTWIDGITYSTSNSVTTHVLTNTAGCDSVVTLDLTIGTVDNGIGNVGFSFTANAIGAQYRWLDCTDEFSFIIGEINQTFEAPPVPGEYAAEVTENGCVDTSICVAIIPVGINDESTFDNLLLYPNPSHGLVTVELGNLRDVSISVWNTVGQLVYIQQHINEPIYQIDLPKVSGVYSVEIDAVGKKINYRLVIE